MIPRPMAGDIAPFYAGYIERIGATDVLDLLDREFEPTLALFREQREDQLLFRYAPGKWSVKQVLGHLIDSERVFQYRALRFARGDRTALPGFEENDYAERGEFDARPVSALLEDFAAVRASTLSLFTSFTPAMIGRRGVANDSEMTVGAIAWVIAGHQHHHVAVLRERYLPHFDR